LRNVAVYYEKCEEDDLIILCSDGVHDNMDPETLGLLPENMTPSFPPETTWVSIKDQDVEKIKSEWMLDFLVKKLITVHVDPEENKKDRAKVFPLEDEEDDMSPNKVNARIIKHCLQITSKSREWMEQNPTSRLPDNYATYPGKMDHATCVTVRIGKYDEELKNVIEKA